MSKKELSECEEKYRSLFDTTSEGFHIIELIYDKAGQPANYRLLEVDQAFGLRSELENIAGKRCKGFILGAKDYWLKAYHEVVQTGNPLRFENYDVATARWHLAYISRISPRHKGRVAVVFSDITEHKRIEHRQSYILKLIDSIRFLSDPDAILQQVTQAAMEYFNADRCYYCEIENGKATIRKDTCRDGLPSVAGVYPLEDFILFEKVINAGHPITIYDVRLDEDVDPELKQLCIRLQVISFAGIPVIKEDKAVGIFCLVQSVPRKWNPMEIQLAEETAERAWSAVEKAKTEKELHESEARYRNEAARLNAVLKSMSDAVYIGDNAGITLANQPALDQLGYSSYDELNRNIGTLASEIQTRDAVTDEVIPPERQAFARALSGEYVTQNVSIRRLKDGTERIVRSAASPVVVDGKIVSAVAVNTDITDTWQTEAALRESEEKLRRFNESLEQQVKERATELNELLSKQKEFEEQQQQQIFRATLDTQEEERRRIAESLHNGLGQILYGAKLSLGQLFKADMGDLDKEYLKNTDKLLHTAITESRRISHELMPVILEDFGLKNAVEDVCRQLDGSIKFKYKFKGLARRLDRYIEIAVYRIIQELMTNIVKHSQAKNALVAIEIRKSQIQLLVQDDGDGFGAETELKNGIGLKTIRNRVSLLNGNINIVSAPAKGVVINIDIPFKN